MSGRVLVLGDDTRSALAVVRSLGRQGIEVHLGSQDSKSSVRMSRYVTKAEWIRPFSVQSGEWVSHLKMILCAHRYNLVIPTSDSYLVPLVCNIHEFVGLSRFAIPNLRAFEYSYYKHKTLAMARKLQIPYPDSLFVQTREDLEQTSSASRFALPLILKPASSAVWRDSNRRDFSVTLARSWPEFYQVGEEILDYVPLLVQTYFQGIGVGQEFLAHNGEVILAFQHRRVHEPRGGGGSSYRVSEALDESMLECSRKILKYLKWDGVIMIEYKKNPASGEFALMEINGRFWGSLPLAVACGADFPFYLYQLLVEEKTPSNPVYRVGIFARNLRRDMGWFLEHMRAERSDPFLPVSRSTHVLFECLNLLSPKEHWDEWTWDDPRPGLWESARLAVELTAKLRKSILATVSRAFWTNPICRKSQRQRYLKLLHANARILVVCRGNICRSPFAEAYFKAKNASLQVISAGIHALGGRRSPTEARRVSREFGLDLDSHRSRVITKQDMDWADLIICMDFRDYFELKRSFRRVQDKIALLKLFQIRGRGIEISDPWRKDANEYRTCFNDICLAIDDLLSGPSNL